MQRFRKREPIEVDAASVTVDNLAEVAEWCHGRIIWSKVFDDDGELISQTAVGIKLLTEQRLQVAGFGDIIYHDHRDYFHVVPPSKFYFEYEEIIKEKDL